MGVEGGTSTNTLWQSASVCCYSGSYEVSGPNSEATDILEDTERVEVVAGSECMHSAGLRSARFGRPRRTDNARTLHLAAVPVPVAGPNFAQDVRMTDQSGLEGDPAWVADDLLSVFQGVVPVRVHEPSHPTNVCSRTISAITTSAANATVCTNTITTDTKHINCSLPNWRG